jgi:tetratricopeptide (TPR) repeat protein
VIGCFSRCYTAFAMKSGGSPKVGHGNLIVCLGFLFSLQVYALSYPTDQFSEAKNLITEGKYAEAEASLRAQITRQPSPDGFDLLGYVFEQQSKLDQAEQAYRQALKLDAERHSSKVRLGIVYGKEGKYIECIAVLEGVHDDVRGDSEALFYLCRAYLEVGKADKALETAALVEGLGENDPGSLLSVGRLLASKDFYQQAVPLLQKSVRLMPKSPEACYSLAFALYKLRKYDEMSIYLDQAQNLDPTQPRILLLRALSLLDTGKVSDAKESISKARALTPDDKFAAYLWGRVLIEERAYPEAIKLISDLIASGYNDPSAHLSLIAAYRKNGEFQKAVDYALKLSQAFPTNASAHLSAGLELEFLGDLDNAQTFLRRAIALSANHPEVLMTAEFTLGAILVKEGQDTEAARLLEDVIRLNPDDVDARVELADLRRRTGQSEEAVKLLQEALSFDPQNKRAHFVLAYVFTKLGKPSEAAQEFKTFQELERDAEKPSGDKSAIYTKPVK